MLERPCHHHPLRWLVVRVRSLVMISPLPQAVAESPPKVRQPSRRVNRPILVSALTRRSLLSDALPLAAGVSQPARTQKDSAVARTAEAIFLKDLMPALSVAAYRGSRLAFADAYGEVDLELAVAAS